MALRSILAASGLVATLAGSPARAEQASPPLDAVFECYRRAAFVTRLDDASIADLCEGASDASPVDCYVDARRRTFLSTPDALSLCRCATGTAPVACYVNGYRTTRLDPSQLLPLCSPEVRLRLAPDCSPER